MHPPTPVGILVSFFILPRGGTVSEDLLSQLSKDRLLGLLAAPSELPGIEFKVSLDLSKPCERSIGNRLRRDQPRQP